jgi:hypothetical protein
MDKLPPVEALESGKRILVRNVENTKLCMHAALDLYDDDDEQGGAIEVTTGLLDRHQSGRH